MGVWATNSVGPARIRRRGLRIRRFAVQICPDLSRSVQIGLDRVRVDPALFRLIRIRPDCGLPAPRVPWPVAEVVAEAAGAVEVALSLVGAGHEAAVSVVAEDVFPDGFLGLGLSGALLDDGQAEQEETEFSGGGGVPSVLVGVSVGPGEQVDLVDEPVGGDAAQDVLAVQAEVFEVGVSGGAGAAEAVADLLQGESLAVEAVGLQHASAASWGWWVGHGAVLSVRDTYVLSVRRF